MGFRGEDSAFVAIWFWLSWGFGCSWRGFWACVGRVSGFAWEDFRLSWERRLSGFRGEDSGFVGIRAFVGWGGFGLSWRGIRGGEAFGLSRGRLRVLVGRLLGEDLGFRSWGYELSWGGIQAFDFTNLRPRAAPLKRIDFANRTHFTKLELRAAPLQKELTWAPSCAGEP